MTVTAGGARSRRRRRIAVSGGVLLVVAGVTLIVSSSIRVHPSKLAQRLSALHGIVISYGDPRQFSVGAYSNTAILPPGIQAEATDMEHASAALEGLERALPVYPPEFVSKLIRAVFISGVLLGGSMRGAGTIGAEWMIIAAPVDLELGSVRESSEVTFHHELSSAVLRRSGKLERWRELWPVSQREVFEYDEVARGPEDRDPDPSSGLLSAYAMTNAENDFNVYAEKVFCDSGALLKLAEAYPLVARKLQLLTEIYIGVDARMGPVFRGLGLSIETTR